MPATRIQDYAVIGDGRSAALVGKDGSIDWLCWPRIDSPSFFAALLDARIGGRWRIAPTEPYRVERQYAEDSNVLVTVFDCAGGRATLTDLMPVSSEEEKRRAPIPEHELLRVVDGVHGEVELELWFEPRPSYARASRPLRATRGLGVRLQDGRHLYTLRSERALESDGDVARGRFTVGADESVCFSLTYDTDGPAVLPPLGKRARAAVQRSNEWWQRWASRSSYAGPYRDQVTRSLLALKLLSFAPSGAIVAAPTTSLPERLGGDLNWDYRFCWVRDASLTVRALFDLGYEDDAEAFVSWLLHSTRLTRPELSVLYDVYGEPPKHEQTLSHLAGHRGSRPVRIQNAAADQLQLDAYGEVIDAVTQLCRHGAPLDRETQRMLRQFGDYVCRNWQRADHGIWEPRETARHHTHSRALCWAALDRLLELGGMGALERLPRGEFEKSRAALRRDLEATAWNPRLRSYTQVLGGDSVDASLVLLSWYGFADPREQRMRSTFALIRERLETAPGLFFRTEESRAIGEGAFGICSFWAAEFLARGGGTLEAVERSFRGLLPYANDVGLLAEEVDPSTGEPLGNFPQAFTHVGLISAAIALEERRRREARA